MFSIRGIFLSHRPLLNKSVNNISVNGSNSNNNNNNIPNLSKVSNLWHSILGNKEDNDIILKSIITIILLFEKGIKTFKNVNNDNQIITSYSNENSNNISYGNHKTKDKTTPDINENQV